MSKRITLILVLSDYRGQDVAEYSTDKGFRVRGSQTNEAPVLYALKRVTDNGDKLEKIIAITTPKARTAYKDALPAIDKFTATMAAASPDTTISAVDIPNDITATDLLRKTLDALALETPPDGIIIETTGGFRTATTALTLLTKFLRYGGIKVEFSTYATYSKTEPEKNHVSDTHETDELFELLDAVNVFAATGSTREIKQLFDNWELAEGEALFTAADNFYNSLLVCRTSRIEDDIRELQTAIEGLKNTGYVADDARLIIFRELVLTIVTQKMTFLHSRSMLADFIKWCVDNWYLQQAVTVLRERLARPEMLSFCEWSVLKCLRNSINHADGTAKCKRPFRKEGQDITDDVIAKVNTMLNDTNQLKSFIETLLAEIKRQS